MKMSEGVEWAAHCAVLLAYVPDGSALPAVKLAEYHGVPTPYLAKSLQALMRAGIVDATPGRYGGYRLARRAEDISLLDIVAAIDGTEPAFRCSEIRPARTECGPSAGLLANVWHRHGHGAGRGRPGGKRAAAKSVADLARHVMDESSPGRAGQGHSVAGSPTRASEQVDHLTLRVRVNGDRRMPGH